MYAKPMDVDPPSIIRVACRNVTGERAKGTIGVRIIVVAYGASNLMIGKEGGMDDNIVVATNANQNTCNEMNRTGNGAAITGDSTNIAVDANVVHRSHRTTSMPSSERGGTSLDVNSLTLPSRPKHLLLPTLVVHLEVEHVRRDMEVGRTSIRTRAAIIGGRLKRPTWEFELFLHTEMPGNPLTTPAVLVNCGPQVDFNASDRNPKRHKRLHARNVDGQFRLEI